VSAILAAITAALMAYTSWVRYQLEHETDQIEDEIDRLAAIGDAASKLRITRLSQRLKRKRESLGVIRPADSDVDPPKAIPVSGGDADGPGSKVS